MALKWFRKKTSSDTSPDADGRAPAQEPSPSGTQADGDPTPPDAEEAEEIEEQLPQQADAQAAPEPHPEPEPEPKGWMARLKRGLAKTRRILTTDIDELFAGKRAVDDEMLEQLEELLITSDIGVQTAMELMEAVGKKARRIESAQALKEFLKERILQLLEQTPRPPQPATRPHVIMVVGVNGVGKTTTIGKLAANATARGQSVLVVAADTFRAAAIEQLEVWAQRAGADIVKHRAEADPAAVAFDGIQAAVARNVDLVLVDTAGRLHTKVNLMEELKKIRRTLGKKMDGAPHETLLVLDATTGQNAVSQARIFHEALGVTGIALTKLDGTAKGGIVVSICKELQIPLQYIGVGEQIEDLQPFAARPFVEALF